MRIFHRLTTRMCCVVKYTIDRSQVPGNGAKNLLCNNFGNGNLQTQGADLDMMMRFTYHALNMLCVLLLCVGDLVKFSSPLPKYKQRSRFSR